MTSRAFMVVAALVAPLLGASGCGGGDSPVVAPSSSSVPRQTQAPTTSAAISDTVTATVSSTTTTTRYLGPKAAFKAAGRTLNVRPSDQRKPYAELGDQLPVPKDIQVNISAPDASAATGFVIPAAAWDPARGDRGQAIELDPTGEPGTWNWRATVPPGEYGLEVTFTITSVPVVVRAPIKVT
jgi:hypothetical protein